MTTMTEMVAIEGYYDFMSKLYPIHFEAGDANEREDWCTEVFGPPACSTEEWMKAVQNGGYNGGEVPFDRNARWDWFDCFICLRDENDALLYKLRWYGADD